MRNDAHGDRLMGRLLAVSAAVLAVAYSTLSIVRHTRFQSGGFDLGIYDQSVWLYSRFLWPYNTIKERFILGDHFTLTLPLLSPLYWIWPDPKILLIFQAVFVSASSIAVFRIARIRGLTPWASYVIALLYLLFYGVQYGIFFDFHPILPGLALVAWMLYFLESGRKKSFVLMLPLVILTQENMSIVLISLGFIYIFRQAYRKTGLMFISVGAVAAPILSRVIAALSPVGFQYWPEISLNPAINLVRMFDSEEKRQVMLYTFSWFSFLPLFSPGAVAAIFIDLAQYFVTGGEFARMWSPFMHHRAILSIFVTLGTIGVLERVRKNTRLLNVVAAVLLVSAMFQQYYFHFAVNKLTKPSFWAYEQWMADNEVLFREIPPDASVAATQSIVPHLSRRKEIYLVWPRMHDIDSKPCGQVSCWWLDWGGNPEYLVVDMHPNQWLTQLLETNEHVALALDAMTADGRIQQVRAVGDARLYRIIRK
jgi:uncharacterized membrane protein